MLCLSGLACVCIVVFGAPFANRLAERYFADNQGVGLILHFNGSFDGADGEHGFETGLSFVPGQKGRGVLFNGEHTLYYSTENNIDKDQGAIEFWLKPEWDGNDGAGHVFFEVGDDWFNRLRIMKDGANNFRFMVWSSKVEYGAACSVSGWRAEEWHQVRVTWWEGRIALYLDGDYCGGQNYVVMPETLSSRIFIGSSAKGDLQAQAVIDEFMIFPEP